MAEANQEINNVTISRVYVDPAEVVIQTDTANGCGSNFYNLPMSNGNFKEMHAYIFLSFKNQTPINLNVYDSCTGDRKIISHGSIEAP